MAKIKYNVKGVDRGGRQYEQPKPGLYEMEIVEANRRDKDGKDDIEVVLEVTTNNNDFVGSRVWSYIGMGEASLWKLGELVDALGLPEEGTLDTAKLVGKKMKVKINADSWNNEYRARAGRFAPLEAEADEEGEGEDDPDAAGDDGEADQEPTVMDRNDVELSTDPAYYEDWSDQDVFDEIENQGLALKGKAAKSRAKVIEALIALVQEEAGGDDGDGADEDDGPDYTEWPDKELAAEYKKRGLTTIDGKKSREKVIKALQDDDADEDDPFAD